MALIYKHIKPKIQFKWNQSQAEAAIKPLLKRNKNKIEAPKTVKKVANPKKRAINKT